MAKMTSGMRMLAMARAQRRDDRGRYSEQGGTEMRYNENRMETEMRRRRDDRGRFMEGAGASNHQQPWHDEHPERMDPFRHDGEREMRAERSAGPMVTGGEYAYQRPDGASGNVRYFKMQKHHEAQEPGRAGRENMQMGFQQQKHGNHQHEEDGEKQGLDKQTAMEWVENMEDGNGVKGGMYSWHQAQQYGRNIGITGEERLVEFYAAMNAMYSDFRPAAKKFGVDKPEFYAMLAKCFIEDPDAVEDKTAKYYEHVVRRE